MSQQTGARDVCVCRVETGAAGVVNLVINPTPQKTLGVSQHTGARGVFRVETGAAGVINRVINPRREPCAAFL